MVHSRLTHGETMFSEKVKEIAKSIGQFYLQKNNGDYIATEKEVLRLQIKKIEFLIRENPAGEQIHEAIITAGRVGLLIGKRGTNIDALTKHLGMKVKIMEDNDPLESYLIPYEPVDDDYPYYDEPEQPPYDPDPYELQ